MSNEDFVIHIGPDDGAGFLITARCKTYGEANGRLIWDSSLEEWASSAEAWRRIPEDGDREDLQPWFEALGNELFDKLFQDKVLELYFKSRALVERDGRGLRLRFESSMDRPDLLRVFSLPWELLCRPKQKFLLLRDDTLVRYLTQIQLLDDRPKVRKLRILAVLAEPGDQRPLEAAKEWEALRTTWAEHPSVEAVALKNPRLDQILEQLEKDEFHVFHFMGHGGFDPRQEKWVLCFSNGLGKTHYASAADIADGLKNARASLRLVVLNACQSARVADPELEGGSNAGAGVASALALQGVNGVVATQAIITDRAAIELTKGLYHRLAVGDSIDEALAEGRRLIQKNEWTRAVWRAEWATPVLFLRGDGQLFDVAWGSGPPDEPPQWRPRPLGLAALASGGVGVAFLAAQGTLWVNPTPHTRVMLVVFGAVLGVLTWMGFRLWVRYLKEDLVHDLSHAVVSRRGLLLALFALPLLSVLLWFTVGVQQHFERSCPSVPPECRKETCVAVLPFEVSPETESDAVERKRNRLSGLDLSAVHFIEIQRPEDFSPICYSKKLQGKVSHGEEDAITYEFTLDNEPIQIEDTIDHVLDDEVIWAEFLKQLLDQGGLPVTAEERETIGGLPSSSREAVELSQRGYEALDVEDWKEAEGKFRAALREDSEFALAHNGLGVALLHKEPALGSVDSKASDFELAIASFRAALDLQPNRGLYHFNLALAFEMRATAAQPGTPYYREDLVRARDAYLRALEHQPDKPSTLNNLGLTEFLLGNVEDAERHLTEGRQRAVQPRDKLSLDKNLGRLALARQDYSTAVEHLREATRQPLEETAGHPSRIEAWYLLALAWDALGDAGQSCGALRSYLGTVDSAGGDRDKARRDDVIQRLGNCQG